MRVDSKGKRKGKADTKGMVSARPDSSVGLNHTY